MKIILLHSAIGRVERASLSLLDGLGSSRLLRESGNPIKSDAYTLFQGHFKYFRIKCLPEEKRWRVYTEKSTPNNRRIHGGRHVRPPAASAKEARLVSFEFTFLPRYLLFVIAKGGYSLFDSQNDCLFAGHAE